MTTTAAEDQHSVTAWGEETFGPAPSPAVLVARAALEMRELQEAVEQNDSEAVGQELADVLIILYRVATIHNLDINTIVDQKMRINRARRWLRKGDGTGRHVK